MYVSRPRMAAGDQVAGGGGLARLGQGVGRAKVRCLLPLPPPAVRRPGAPAWPDWDWVVGKWGQGDVLPLPPSVVRRLVAVVWRDRAFVEEGRHLVDLSLPPPPPVRRLAAAVLVHCPLPQPPPIKHRAAAARRDRDMVVGGRPGADRLLPLLVVAR